MISTKNIDTLERIVIKNNKNKKINCFVEIVDDLDIQYLKEIINSYNKCKFWFYTLEEYFHDKDKKIYLNFFIENTIYQYMIRVKFDEGLGFFNKSEVNSILPSTIKIDRNRELRKFENELKFLSKFLNKKHEYKPEENLESLSLLNDVLEYIHKLSIGSDNIIVHVPNEYQHEIIIYFYTNKDEVNLLTTKTTGEKLYYNLIDNKDIHYFYYFDMEIKSIHLKNKMYIKDNILFIEFNEKSKQSFLGEKVNYNEVKETTETFLE